MLYKQGLDDKVKLKYFQTSNLHWNCKVNTFLLQGAQYIYDI